ncbi:FUSC family protein [Kineococcus arenarius]|uniref:FUSC family protein n=1 Tax=Kineococcus sp. SYSU DK007 TaxID=3383128 RepID=UPI003D7C73D7
MPTAALLHLARSVRGWGRLAPGPTPWADACAALVWTAVPLALVLAAGTPLLAAPATFGAMAGVYGRAEPYARRWRTQAAAGVVMSAALLAGALAGIAGRALPVGGWGAEVVPALVVAVVALLAKLLSDAVRTGPPGGLMPVFAAGTLAHTPLTAADLPAVVLVALACAAFAAAVSAAPGLRRPDGPERDAVARALGAVLAAVHDPAAHGAAALAVHRAWDVLAPGAARTAGDPTGPARWLAHAERLLHAAAGPAPTAGTVPAPRRRVLAADVDAARAALSALRGRGPLPPVPARAGALAEVLGHGATGDGRLRAIADALRPASVLHAPALRVGAACAVSAVLAAAAGLGHTYWAAVAAAAALQSPSLGVTTRRAVQRSLGTLAGLVLAALLVPLATGDASLWASTVACMFLVELLMPRNLALGTVPITALSLLLTRLGSTATPLESLAGDRVLDTLLGVAIGVVAALAVRNRHARTHLERALGAVARSSAAGDAAALRHDLAVLRDAHDLLADDSWGARAGAATGPTATVDPERVQRAERDGYRRLGELLGAGA